MFAVTLIGVSFSGRELAVLAAVVVLVAVFAIWAFRRRRL